MASSAPVVLVPKITLNPVQQSVCRAIDSKLTAGRSFSTAAGLSEVSRVWCLDSPGDVFPEHMIFSFNERLDGLSSFAQKHGVALSHVISDRNFETYIGQIAEAVDQKLLLSFVDGFFQLAKDFAIASRSVLLEPIDPAALSTAEARLGIQFRLQPWLKEKLQENRRILGLDYNAELRTLARNFFKSYQDGNVAKKDRMKILYPDIQFDTLFAPALDDAELLVLGEHLLAGAMVSSLMKTRNTLSTFFLDARIDLDALPFEQLISGPAAKVLDFFDLAVSEKNFDRMFSEARGDLVKHADITRILDENTKEISLGGAFNTILLPPAANGVAEAAYLLCGQFWEEIKTMRPSVRADGFNQAIRVLELFKARSSTPEEVAVAVQGLLTFMIRHAKDAMQLSRILSMYSNAFTHKESKFYQVMSSSEAKAARDEILAYAQTRSFSRAGKRMVTARSYSVWQGARPVPEILNEIEASYKAISMPTAAGVSATSASATLATEVPVGVAAGAGVGLLPVSAVNTTLVLPEGLDEGMTPVGAAAIMTSQNGDIRDLKSADLRPVPIDAKDLVVLADQDSLLVDLNRHSYFLPDQQELFYRMASEFGHLLNPALQSVDRAQLYEFMMRNWSPVAKAAAFVAGDGLVNPKGPLIFPQALYYPPKKWVQNAVSQAGIPGLGFIGAPEADIRTIVTVTGDGTPALHLEAYVFKMVNAFGRIFPVDIRLSYDVVFSDLHDAYTIIPASVKVGGADAEFMRAIITNDLIQKDAHGQPLQDAVGDAIPTDEVAAVIERGVSDAQIYYFANFVNDKGDLENFLTGLGRKLFARLGPDELPSVEAKLDFMRQSIQLLRDMRHSIWSSLRDGKSLSECQEIVAGQMEALLSLVSSLGSDYSHDLLRLQALQVFYFNANAEAIKDGLIALMAGKSEAEKAIIFTLYFNKFCETGERVRDVMLDRGNAGLAHDEIMSAFFDESAEKVRAFFIEQLQEVEGVQEFLKRFKSQYLTELNRQHLGAGAGAQPSVIYALLSSSQGGQELFLNEAKDVLKPLLVAAYDKVVKDDYSLSGTIREFKEITEQALATMRIQGYTPADQDAFRKIVEEVVAERQSAYVGDFPEKFTARMNSATDAFALMDLYDKKYLSGLGRVSVDLINDGQRLRIQDAFQTKLTALVSAPIAAVESAAGSEALLSIFKEAYLSRLDGAFQGLLSAAQRSSIENAFKTKLLVLLRSDESGFDQKLDACLSIIDAKYTSTGAYEQAFSKELRDFIKQLKFNYFKSILISSSAGIADEKKLEIFDFFREYCGSMSRGRFVFAELESRHGIAKFYQNYYTAALNKTTDLVDFQKTYERYLGEYYNARVSGIQLFGASEHKSILDVAAQKAWVLAKEQAAKTVEADPRVVAAVKGGVRYQSKKAATAAFARSKSAQAVSLVESMDQRFAKVADAEIKKSQGGSSRVVAPAPVVPAQATCASSICGCLSYLANCVVSGLSAIGGGHIVNAFAALRGVFAGQSASAQAGSSASASPHPLPPAASRGKATTVFRPDEGGFKSPRGPSSSPSFGRGNGQ